MPLRNEFRGLTALIVDDEPVNINIAERILAYHGITVYTAPDGLEGLRVLETTRLDFVLLDLMMPRMDGWQTLGAIRQNPSTMRVPVIAYTAAVASRDRGRVLGVGFDGFISKPFDVNSFLMTIRSLNLARRSD